MRRQGLVRCVRLRPLWRKNREPYEDDAYEGVTAACEGNEAGHLGPFVTSERPPRRQLPFAPNGAHAILCHAKVGVSNSSMILAAALIGAGIFAALRSHGPPVTTTAIDREERRATDDSFDPSIVNGDDELPPNHPPVDSLGNAEGDLPPNHPPIGMGAAQPSLGSDRDAPAAITWTAPAKWTSAPNPNAMRLATYRVPPAGSGGAAELTVVRAGGSTEANLKRWIDQFENPEGVQRAQRTIHGLVVSTIEVRGTFRAGGMGPQDSTEPRRGWMLEGAVVETDQGPYFFKLTGPSQAVKAARTDFEALLESLTPAKNSQAP